MQAWAQGNTLSGPVLREEAGLAVPLAHVLGGMGMCWAGSQHWLERAGRGRGESQWPVLGPGDETRMLLHYFPRRTNFCSIVGNVFGDLREG